jgi:Fe-S-cluster containining protein
MKPSLTDTLCPRCGLCCDGSLFADVELAGTDEASSLEVMGLEIEDADEDDAGLLVQPCGALKGKRCSIYPHRPDCCRTFECRLLQQVKRGAVSVPRAKVKIAEALKRIERVEELIARLGPGNERLPLKERCAEALALAAEAEPDPGMNRKRAELQAAMTSVQGSIQETFLGRLRGDARLIGKD